MEKIFTFKLPDIGEGVVEGEVIEWLKSVGDVLKKDEPVVVVMTDKATVELPAPYQGTLVKQYFSAGQTAIKDKPLYDIAVQGDEILPESLLESRENTQAIQGIIHEKPCNTKEKGFQKHTENSRGRGLAIPKLRKMAKDFGLDLSLIEGSGNCGRVTVDDLKLKLLERKQVVQEKKSLPGDYEEPLIGIRALMAKKMAESKSKIPHFSYFEQVEVERLIQLKTNTKRVAEIEGVHVTYMPFLIKALSLCIKKYPILNSSCNMEEGKLIYHKPHNIGIAMSTRLGLIVPVLKNVEDMQIEALIRAYDDLMHRAYENKLLSCDMKEATITISNFGHSSSSGLWATPIINFPEVAILGISKIHPQVVVKNGNVVVREVLNLSWSFDHRAIDGDTAVRISHDFCSYIRDPASLL